MKNIKLKYDDLFIKGAKLNFKNFPSLELDGNNLEFLHLISSTILSGHLHNVNFYNASFLSTKFSKVTFAKCNLKCTDICSIWAKNCCFQETDFSNATISDSTFIKCTFNGSIFESVSLVKCQFIDCTFEQFFIDDSTFSLNTFINCSIKNTQFTESFYYQIFDNCTFHDVNMSPSLLGYNFVFSSKVFNQLTEGVNLSEIDMDFITNGLYINAAIFRVNQIQSYYDQAMIACVSAIGKMIEHDILIKADEIEFLKNLTSYFYEHNKIVPISILRIWRLLNNYTTNILSNTSSSKAMPHIREYANTLYFKFIDFQKKLQKCLDQLPNKYSIIDTAELKIVYSEKPTFPLLNLLTEFNTLVHPKCPVPELIRTEEGSFVEYHNIAVAVIPYLQTCLSFLGIIVPIIIYKKERQIHDCEVKSKKAMTVDKPERAELEITLPTNAVKQSPSLLPGYINITPTTNTIVSNTIKILESQQEMNCAGFCGYNAQNIQSITVRFYEHS